MSLRRTGCLALLVTSSLFAQTQLPASPPPNPNRPTLFLVGDLPSSPIQAILDPDRLKLVESSTGGKTTRSYINSGDWDKLLAEVKPGDFVLIGFKPGTNTGASTLATDAHAAATQTFDGPGDATFDYMDPDTHILEHVHTYAWYLRKFVVDSISHGATPLLSYPPVPPDPANPYPNNPYLARPAWIIRAIAAEQRIPYIDLAVAGAAPNATDVRTALESLHPDPLDPYFIKKTP